MEASQSKRMVSGEPLFFDVTCVIGRVELDPDSPDGAFEAAMRLIAAHEHDGVFQFPGRKNPITVTVEGLNPFKPVRA